MIIGFNQKMKWKKLGKIFNPIDYNLINNCKFFAQAPQLIEFDDHVKIYFSSRETDLSGNQLSHVFFVEMEKNLSKVINVSNHNIISLGKLGCYDEHGIFPFNVLKVDNKYLGFIGGWNRRSSVDVDGAIGISKSKDGGQTFERLGDGPVLASTLNEPFLIMDPFVLRLNNIFHMWYIFGVQWIRDPESGIYERVYKIGHAYSKDAFNWEKTGLCIIPDHLSKNECQALPSVIFHDSRFHMVFCFRHVFEFRKNIKQAYRLGYAYSKDGINWTREDKKLNLKRPQRGWDSQMMCYPNLSKINGEIFLLYNGNNFGKYGFGAAQLSKNKF